MSGRKTQEEVDAKIEARVDARLAEMLPAVMSELEERLKTARVAAGTDQGVDKSSDRNLIASLATAIVKAGDPTNTKQLDPTVLQMRMDAHGRMIDLIMRFNAERVIPVYIVRATMYLNDTLIQPQWQDPGSKRFFDTEINWDKIPNEAMEPKNDAAKQIYLEYKRSIGNIDQEGVPQAPWLSAQTPWIQSSEGIVRGREMAPMPEFPVEPGPYNDPRRGGAVPMPGGRPDAAPTIPIFGTAGVVQEVKGPFSSIEAPR
jgi:hypothetical protein